MKRQEYNKRYYAKKKQEEFVKAAKTLEANWYIAISRWELIDSEKKEKKLHNIIVILSIIVVILFFLILIK
jgi:hypothetical protein